MKPLIAAACLLASCGCTLAQPQQSEPNRPRIVSRDVTPKRPPFYLATYATRQGLRLVSPGGISSNNGKTWKALHSAPDFDAKLPFGYRRSPNTALFDPESGRLLMMVNALDTPGLDPKAIEPAIARSEYYIRYRVSKDGGRNWLFDEPIVAAGNFDEKHPFADVYRGKNAVYLGDSGGAPIRTQSGRILVPVQMTVAGSDGRVWNPSKQPTYTDVFVLLGQWQPNARIQWQSSSRVHVSPDRSTRGLIEPTLAQLPDGRVLMVMRGSNAGKASLPSYRWYSVSRDDGATWSEAKPWAYDDGHPYLFAQ